MLGRTTVGKTQVTVAGCRAGHSGGGEGAVLLQVPRPDLQHRDWEHGGGGPQDIQCLRGVPTAAPLLLPAPLDALEHRQAHFGLEEGGSGS